MHRRRRPLHGTFSGNRVPLNGGTGTSVIDPVFFDEYAPAAVTPTINLTSSANPSVFGQSVHFSAGFTPSGTTGMVQFVVDGTNLGSPVPFVGGTATSPSVAGTALGASGSINAAGLYSITTSGLSVGDHPITAVYGG